ncbi:MAG: hypothetical protein K8S97_14055 [Anaerolineae bacterium]|nr:hypothetical protein [Anaerolineae bacterium]
MTDDGVNLGFVVEVVEGDALNYAADVLAVKHAPRSGGLGAQVRKHLKGDIDILPRGDEYRVFPGRNVAQTEYILMVGAPPEFSLLYPQLRELARRFLEALWESGVDVEHLLTTLHGVRTGVGLDEVEAFRSMLLGLADAYESGRYPPTLKRVTFIEQDDRRVQVIQEALPRFLPAAPAEEPAPESKKTVTSTAAVISGQDSFEPEFRGPAADEDTPHVFVAMPFRDDYDDQYYLAMQPVVHEAGLLCERMDLDAFTGDIKVRMLERIRSARLMIALLDDANPNVYLEVGYAWGVETPTILVAHTETPLPFDVRGERVLIYDKIYRLKEMLTAELKRLLG